MAAEPFLISSLFTSFILPFVLVFTLIFAILEKTQVLGEGKKQINAIIGLVVGLILISVPFARDIVSNFMPFLAISAVVLFVFMLLYGFIFGKKEDVLDKGVKIALGIILGLAVISVLIYLSGYGGVIYDFFFNRADSSQIWINVLLIVVIGGAIAAAVSTKEK